ncbi:FMRFamide-related peptides [Ochlerotatus camptorhynchus]|uniref:FMRFamide-related peptides n=1 Tax=Ochlerotatus camptorhynchus TaxID=644619 RepID=UPI0031E1B6EE
MKMYLFLAILIYKCSNHLSCAEYELAETSQAENDPSVSLDYNPGNEGDYSNNNGVVFEFRRSIKSDNTEIEARRRSALDKNFMRFGRTDPTTLQRVARASKQANLMRFGRAGQGFMRFGRIPTDVPYSLVHYEDLNDHLDNENAGDSSEESTYSKRTPNSDEITEVSDSGEQIKPKQFVYYRRDSPKNLMRFGKRADANKFLRLDRANLMRFGRAGANLQRGNLLRFGRASGNLMRFGRSKGNLMRFGRSDPRFLRLMKMDNNFMRFGRSDKTLKASSRNGTGTESLLTTNVEINPSDKNNAPSKSDEDYEIHLREEDILAPFYVSNN